MKKFLPCFMIIFVIFQISHMKLKFSNSSLDIKTNFDQLQILVNQKNVEQKCHCKPNEYLHLHVTGKKHVKINYSKNGSVIRNYMLPQELIESSKLSCHPFNVLSRGPNQKIISYSVFGKDKTYRQNLKKIVIDAKKLYPDWTIRIYHDDQLTHSEICDLECFTDQNLQTYDNFDFCNISDLVYENWNPQYMIKTFWRWLPIGDTFVDYFMSRDTDSCLIERERDAVNEWLDSGKLFHIMRGNLCLFLIFCGKVDLLTNLGVR